MVARRNHASPPLKRTFARLSKIERNPQLGHSSVSEGQTQFIGEESWSLLGSGLVQGLLRILGELGVEGTLTITGQVNGSGDITWTGTFTLTDGGTITVGSNGKIIIAGAVPITLEDGRIKFADGSYVYSDGSALAMVASAVLTMTAGSDVNINAQGNVVITATNGDVVVPAPARFFAMGNVHANGEITAPNLPSVTGVTPNLYWDQTDKKIKHVT